MDILQQIDEFLEKNQYIGDRKYVDRESAIEIINIFLEEVKDDKILLEMVKVAISRNWSSTNTELIEKFYNLLSYYGVFSSDGVQRKTVLESKGKTVVRKFITIKNKERIYNILEMYGR